MNGMQNIATGERGLSKHWRKTSIKTLGMPKENLSCNEHFLSDTVNADE